MSHLLGDFWAKRRGCSYVKGGGCDKEVDTERQQNGEEEDGITKRKKKWQRT